MGHIRFFRPRPIFLGFDVVGPSHHEQEKVFWRETSDDAPGPVVLFYRSKRYQKDLEHSATEWPCHSVTDGYFRPFQGIAAACLAILDCLSVFWRLSWLPTDYFWEMAKMPYSRYLYRALFTRFPCRNFWGRDDYNSGHIIRYQELRRLGGKSFGLLHGLPSKTPVICQRRYIDFDVYYVFGDDLHRFYRDTWPPDMVVKATGSWGMTREEFARLDRRRPKDIIYFSCPSLQENSVIDTLVQIAEAFPDRTVYLRPKYPESVDETKAGLDRLSIGKPENIVVTHERSYELVFKAHYVLSDPSTIGMECIQFGLPTFVAKFGSEWGNIYVSEFPELCVDSAQEFIDRIKGIESGTYVYRREDYAGLINLSGDIIWDTIRADLGLPPKHEAKHEVPDRHPEALTQ